MVRSRARANWKRAYRLVRKRKYVTKVGMARYVNRTIEKKYFEDSSSSEDIVNTWTMYPLTHVPQGTTADTDVVRQGDKIYPTGLEFRWSLTSNATANSNQIVRIIIFMYKQIDSATEPVHGTILAHPSSFPWISPYHHDNKGIYRIFMDRYISLPNETANGKKYYPQKTLYIPRKKLKEIKFGGGGVYGRNHIYMMTIGSEATNEPILQYHSRLHFTDQ